MVKCKQAIALVGLLLAIPLPTRAAEAPQNLTVLEMPSAVPAIGFTDAVGQPKKLADYSGKVVLPTIWATWCAPCRKEMPTLDRLQGELVLALGLLKVGGAVAALNQIVVERTWARATPKMAVTGGGYLTVTNRGPGEDRLLNVTSPVAEKIQFHAMAIDNGVAKMTRLLAIELHPGVPVVFKPGGIHMMLLGLKHQLKEGETVPLTLRFEKADAIEVDAKVLGIAATGDPGNQTGSGN